MPMLEKPEELRQAFQSEGYSYVSRARQILSGLVAPAAEQDLETLAGETRMLKQRASLAGMLDISNLAYQLEGEIKRLEETESELTAANHETLESYVDSIEQFMHFYYQHTIGASVEQLLKPEEGFQLTRQIRELYLVESRDHIQDINARLLELEAGKVKTAHALEEIYRGVHSIKGDSNALSLNEVADKAHALETLLSELQQHKKLSHEQIETLFAGIAELEAMVAVAASEEAAKLESEVAPLVETLTEPVLDTVSDPVSDVSPLAETPALEASADEDDDLDYLFEDTTILELYYQEAQDLMAEVGSGLIQLRDEPGLGPLINDVYRAAHTLKGNSYALGVESVGKWSKQLEETLQPMRAVQRCDSAGIDALERLLEGTNAALARIGNRLGVSAAPAPQTVAVQQPAATQSVPQALPDLPEMEIPEEIRQIYLEESTELMDHVTQQLLALELGQIPLTQALDEIYRAVHTLKGNSNALGLEQIGALTHDFESFLDELRARPERFNELGPESMFRQIEPLQQLFARLGGVAPAEAEAVSPALAAVIPPDIDLSEIPEEIRQIFLEEGRELLDSVSKQLLDLEQGAISLESALEETYRAIHTLKGNANALGIGWIGESAHSMETLLSSLREDPGSYGPQVTEALFRHLEGLRRQAEALDAAGAPEPEMPKDIRRTTSDLKVTLITTQERTPQQVIEAVRRDKSLFEEFEQRISGSRPEIDVRTTGEHRLDKLPGQTSQQPAAVDETIRVSIGKVDKLINLADELLISRISFEQHLRTLRGMVGTIETAQNQLGNQLSGKIEQLGEAEAEAVAHLRATLDRLEAETAGLTKGIRKNNAAFGLLVDEIQYHARSTRMLPAAYLLNPLRLVVRNTSSKLAKKVQLQIIGEEIEMDRLLIERLKDPLAHLLRNAIDHGVETPEQRAAAGKPGEAKITIAISVAGNMIRFQIHDDGRGLNYQKIRAKAVRSGLATPELAEQLSEYDLHNMLFMPGFTTTEQVTDISGRGVGLDVVKATLDSLNGSIEVTSADGRGTIFTLLVPVTLTTFDAFLVQMANQTFALPRSSVLATLSVNSDEVSDSGISKAIYFDGQPVRLVSLRQLLQLPEDDESDEFAVLVVEAGAQRMALMVDQVTESQQMVMKSLGSQLRKVPFVSGATVLGSGEPVVVLNLTEIVTQLANLGSERLSVMVQSQPVSEAPRKGKTRVLVVDDSVTTRTLEKNILEAAGFEVVIAKNGKEGQAAVIREMPNLDLVITDVEMPQMNGYEFASWLKLESEFRKTPVIMVSSLATPELKAKGYACGIDAYIVKGEFNQQNLMETISRLLSA